MVVKNWSAKNLCVLADKMEPHVRLVGSHGARKLGHRKRKTDCDALVATATAEWN